MSLQAAANFEAFKFKVALITPEMSKVTGHHFLTHSYIHKSNIHQLPEEQKIWMLLALRAAGEFEYDLVKVAHDGSHVCLLRYPKFDVDPLPALMYSVKIFLPSGRCCITDYTKFPHPPTLYRKATLVSPDYPFVNQRVKPADTKKKTAPSHCSHCGWHNLCASRKTPCCHALLNTKN
jgi:hypothetical protein